MSDISRQIYENKKEVQEFVKNANEEFSDLVSPDKIPELDGISERLTDSLQRYYKDSKLHAKFELNEGISVEFPSPTIRIEDQGFLTGLENVGHGLQRATLFAIIQFLAERYVEDSGGEEFEEAQSDIILLIEEPEIYQHPHKQLTISDAFHEICSGFSKATGIRFQIIFTTHSEKFVGIQKFHSARILRRLNNGSEPSHSISAVSISEASSYFADLVGKKPMPNAAFEAKMHIFSREVCEGFFAEKVILVEGVTDKAVLEGYYRSKERNVNSEGLAIIAVDGKTKIDKPFYVFQSLGIPVFVVFDSDKRKGEKHQRTEANKIIQRIGGVDDPLDFPDGVYDRFAAFEFDLEGYLTEVIGVAKCDEIKTVVCDEFGLSFADLCKTPLAVLSIVEAAMAAGISFGRFDEVIEMVDRLES